MILTTAGCQKSTPEAGSITGYDKGEKYLSIWVHSIEDTDEGRCYREAVNSFNKAYDGKYFADIEFIPRNDSGGGYSDKINASVMSGDLPDVLTVDGPNMPKMGLYSLWQKSQRKISQSILSLSLNRVHTMTSCMPLEQWSQVSDFITTRIF